MTPSLLLIGFVILVALAFDFINGFHDAANSIATVVSTRVLTPGKAVVWAAAFNFVAAFVFGTTVANAVGSGMVDAAAINPWVILAALLGAIVWNLITWYWGLPASSSHALIGGLVGATLVHAGPHALLLGWNSKIMLSVYFIILSPLIGMVLGLLFMLAVSWIFRRWQPSAIDRFFRVGQLFSAAAYSLGHGGNDAQKTMGVIVALMTTVKLDSWAYRSGSHEVAWWIILACQAAIAFGTMTGGWRIVKTMGQKITKLKPVGGFCAESAGAVALFTASAMGIPVSTTHTITGSIMGVGSLQSLSAVKWGVAENILWAWILTIPAAAIAAALCQLAFQALGLGV